MPAAEAETPAPKPATCGPPPPVVIGLDLGTSSVKAVAFDERGRAVASSVRELALRVSDDRVEQSAQELLAAAAQATTGLTAALRARGNGPRTVRALALSAALHALVGLDARGQPVTPVMTYADTRAGAQAAWLGRTDPGLPARTGAPLHPMSPLVKLRWFRECDPGTAAGTARWASPKELLLHALSGRWLVDRSVASATGLYALEQRTWDARALQLAGVDEQQLSELVSPTAVLDGMDPAWARQVGLDPATPVVVGGGDGCLANLGSGAVDAHTGCLTLGTSGAVRVVTAQPSTDAGGTLFCYVLTDDRFVVGGPISNGGVVLRWARERLFPDLAAEAARHGSDVYALFDELAGSVPSGAQGLLFLPHLLGERAPVWDPTMRGALLGLTASHGRAHILRAMLEGVAHQLATVVDVLAQRGLGTERLRAGGGFTGSPLWLRITSEVLGRPLEVVAGSDASCLGAALLARQALGDGDALTLARDLVQVSERVQPRPDDARLHARLRPVFAGARADIAATSAALAALAHEAPRASEQGGSG